MSFDPTDDAPLLGSVPALADADWQHLLERAAEAATGVADHLISGDDPFLDDGPAFTGTDDSSFDADTSAESDTAHDDTTDTSYTDDDGTHDDDGGNGTDDHGSDDHGYGERYDGMDDIGDSPDAIDFDY